LSGNRKLNILIVAFAFPPNKRVGAMRAGYWHRNLTTSLDCEISVITGQEDARGNRIHVVPKLGNSWMTRFIADDGVIWKTNIKDYIEQNEVSKPDLVIITGGPFMHFSLTPWFKKKFGCKVILDYRDPFATNPGFNNGWLKSGIKRYFEKRFNRKADALVTVNTYCGKIIEEFHSKPNSIIQNGFDESSKCEPSQVTLEDSLSFSYAGKFYFHPEHMVSAMNESEVGLSYIGPDKNQLDTSGAYIKSLGFVDYSTAIEVIGSADVGVIQTYGHEFQSTTKIFDYVRCERAILIISDDKIEEGSIHDELQNYPNVVWAKNNKASIIDAINQLKASTYSSPPIGFAEKYSRGYQLKNLVALIKELGL
tara:strand:+ start:7201 stop:8298 length:1098 start_codon:yes stop_codon:yes gene_type:complete